ncbi:MAG: PilZ domain-containing protein [Emcibacter sp.]|nr:PilZ domain-containing protein [Emcibacter sp.]
MSKANKELREESRRQITRQPVLLKAMLDTGDYEFKCVAHDLSLNGIKVKLALPLETECEVWLMVKDSPHIPARVAWARDGFIGLEFSLSPQRVAKALGTIGARLPRV